MIDIVNKYRCNVVEMRVSDNVCFLNIFATTVANRYEILPENRYKVKTKWYISSKRYR